MWPLWALAAALILRIPHLLVEIAERFFSPVQLLNSVSMDLSWNHSLDVPCDSLGWGEARSAVEGFMALASYRWPALGQPGNPAHRLVR